LANASADAMRDSNSPPRPAAPGGAVRRTWRLARLWFASDERATAWGLAIAAIGLRLVQVAVQLRLNLWHRDAFDALQRQDQTAFTTQAGWFLLIALASMAVAVAQLWSVQMLALRWRRWLVEHLQARLTEGATLYHLTLLPGAADNPDQRISENTRWATFIAVDLALGLLQAGLMLVSFLGVLWTLSGPLVLGAGVVLPGWLVFAAMLYAAVGLVVTLKLGRPMISINIGRNEAEADHRFALLRLREHAEAVALIGGGRDEARGLSTSFGRVVTVMRDLLRRERHLMWLGSGYGLVAGVLPLLLLGPRYFAGAITLGGLMQAGSAFVEVTRALAWFQENWPRLADWRSHVERVVALEDSLDAAAAVSATRGVTVLEGHGQASEEMLAFDAVSLRTPEGTLLVADATARIRARERVLIQGASGAGKSTLLRAAAGLWPWGTGRILVPPREAMMVLPQRPYLPLGTLRAALAYPAGPSTFATSALAAALERCDLAHLAPRLEETARWERVLSLGEQQRLGFARLLLHRPRWVLMDEATSALDEASQDAMMALFTAELADSALVSVGHRPGLDAWHDRTLVLVRGPEGARLRPCPQGPAASGFQDAPPGLALAGWRSRELALAQPCR